MRFANSISAVPSRSIDDIRDELANICSHPSRDRHLVSIASDLLFYLDQLKVENKKLFDEAYLTIKVPRFLQRFVR